MVTFNLEACERESCGSNKSQSVSFPRFDVDCAQTGVASRSVRIPSSFAVHHHHRSLTTPCPIVSLQQSFLDGGIIFSEYVLDEYDFLVIIVIGLHQVIDDERAGCGHSLESNVRVVEICPCHTDGDSNFVVEEV